MIGVRIPLPTPRDAALLLDRATTAGEQLSGLLPRLLALVDHAERLVARADALLTSVEQTRREAQATARRADALVADATAVAERVSAVTGRITVLLDAFEPALTRLRPTLDRLAETTSPAEVEALVELVDKLPLLATKLEVDVLPILDSLGTVAPDLHDLLGVSRELNELIGHVPGLSRIKRKVDEEQAERSKES